MDFAFGTYSNDALKLANHRAARSGIQHQNHISPIDPPPGQPVTIHVVTSGDSGVEQAALVYTTDESPPQGGRGTAQNGQVVRFERVSVEWDSLVWGYITHWQAVIPAQPDGTLVQYIISGWSEGGSEIYADWPRAQEQVQHEAMIFFDILPEGSPFTPHDPSKGQVFSYQVDTIQPPAWARDAVIYQVVVDRFYPGDGRPWQPVDTMEDVFGGTLWGVRDKLDYIAELGAGCIWLSPTWASPTYHGYDVVDYDRIEPGIGGEDALRTVIEGAHQRGIRVLLDMACNHLSNEHPFFVEALNDPKSPYRSWFFFDDKQPHGYQGFFGVRTMPEVNLANPAARDWMIGNAVRWLREFDIDGYRLDYANGPGPDFWTHFRRACKAVNPGCFLFGEIVEPASVLRRYTGRLDGCLDFPLNDAFRRTYGWQAWDEARFERFVTAHDAYFDRDFLMPSFLDNHDMDRFSFIAKNDNDLLKQAVVRQFQRPGPIVILYGTEVGLRQDVSTRDHGLSMGRVPMVWGDAQDADLLAFYKQQIQARTS